MEGDRWDRQLELGSICGEDVEAVQWKLPGIHEMIIAKTSSNGDREPEVATFCNYERLPVEELRNQASQKPFNLQFVLTPRCAGIKVVQIFLH